MPDSRPARRPGDGWVACSCGREHWGLLGAAGLLVFRDDDAGPRVLLQHRALWSHHGGTWGIPGGAIDVGESPLTGALREAGEEAGICPSDIEPIASLKLDHGTWSYTTIVARLVGDGLDSPIARDSESIELRWAGLDEVPGLPLLPAFGEQWPLYLAAYRRALSSERRRVRHG
ncbi:hypothetical protein GCM10010401_18590 [Rarobacter faecitabidus]|uniref:ADP-ribose pyrophosphatase YjhB (NUDIX family) n=1 Tax=Rarobacter faecitabidus TaxID=13243 RepID=A0A542ZUU2_RARFA|nr:NUDIX domain-containing protein [Rarobacter faecitabidus]TQL64069.1 ADP-ribose pyrophosphatase YjhB (NUDIX family) [Rarobacter faecitabidus]